MKQRDKMKLYIFLLTIFVSIITPSAMACTDIHFNMQHNVLAARNMDWFDPVGFVVINPRGVHRISYDGIHKQPCLSWVAKYGSVTFDVGKQHVAGQEGMNERGLVASVLWLSTTRYPLPDHRPTVPTGYWVQYILDNYATVNEVIAHMPEIRVVLMRDHQYMIKQHLILYDPSGNTAILEYLDGNLVMHQGNPISVPILTNDPYAQSIASLKSYQSFGGTQSIPTGYDSQARFIKAAYFRKKIPPIANVNKLKALAFKALHYVAQPVDSKYATQWSVVSDLTHKTIDFRSIHNPKIRHIDLKKINFAKDAAVKMLAIDGKQSGTILQ